MARDADDDCRARPSRESSLVWLLVITFFTLVLGSFGVAVFASIAASAEVIELYSTGSDSGERR